MVISVSGAVYSSAACGNIAYFLPVACSLLSPLYFPRRLWILQLLLCRKKRDGPRRSRPGTTESNINRDSEETQRRQGKRERKPRRAISSGYQKNRSVTRGSGAKTWESDSKGGPAIKSGRLAGPFGPSNNQISLVLQTHSDRITYFFGACELFKSNGAWALLKMLFFSRSCSPPLSMSALSSGSSSCRWPDNTSPWRLHCAVNPALILRLLSERSAMANRGYYIFSGIWPVRRESSMSCQHRKSVTRLGWGTLKLHKLASATRQSLIECDKEVESEPNNSRQVENPSVCVVQAVHMMFSKAWFSSGNLAHTRLEAFTYLEETSSRIVFKYYRESFDPRFRSKCDSYQCSTLILMNRSPQW